MKQKDALVVTTYEPVSLSANLQSPSDNVKPSNDFIKFELDWTKRSIPDCFRNRLKRGDADRIALGLPHRDFSYQELDELSDHVAYALNCVCRPGSEPILMLLEHEAPVPAAMLGVLKIGKFYVPLDPSYPIERNRYVLQNSQARILITNSRNIDIAHSLCGSDCPILNLDDIATQFCGDYPQVTNCPDDLVQVLYTSGSSGKPKGVMHTHHSLLYNVMRHTNGRRTCETDRIAILFSYSFGPAIVNVFSAILNGAAAFPFNVKEWGVTQLAKWLVDREITQMHTVPTLFRHFTDALVGNPEFPALRLIELGGETMFAKDLERFKRHFDNNCLLSIGMGSAETGHVFDCGYNKQTECPTDILPAGYPVEGTHPLLLDEQGQPVAIGQVGEIAIKGSFLSPGYWRQPELTARSFLPDPAGGPDRIYLTGDLGCMLPDRCAFHLGRKDSRVKVRGYRIEVPEVEAALLEAPDVKDVAVIAKDVSGEDKRLVAFVASKTGSMATVPSLRRFLRGKLPAYMIPTAFVVLESLPLLPNGKINRQALQDYRQEANSGEKRNEILTNPTFRSPGNAGLLLEAELCAIWEELLGVDHIGPREDFFDLGGDSFLVVEMVCRIEEICGRRLSFSGLDSEITIERLALAITEQEREDSKAPFRAFQVKGAKRPLFFHNGDCEAGGLYCRNLAKHLGPDRPFYSLMAHGFHKDHVPETIEAMAADRLRSVLANQPKGPYLLGGFCYGGLVAFEMAQQLKQRGEEVEAVLMIDTLARNIPFRLLRRIVAILGSLLRLRPTHETEIFRRVKNFFVAIGEARKRGVWKGLRYIGDKSTSHFIQTIRRIGQLLVSNGSKRTVNVPEWDMSTPYRHTHLAVDAYVPGRYSGKIVFLRSTSMAKKAPDDPTGGWNRVTSNLKIEWIQGDHHRCVAKYVTDLAEKMRPHLERTSG